MSSSFYHRIARDAAREVQEDAAKAASLYERLSAMIGPWERTGAESHADIARYGLAKFGLKAPTDDTEAAQAMEAYLIGRAHAADGSGMDRAAGPFNWGRNPHQVSAFDSVRPTDASVVERYVRGELPDQQS